MRRTLTLNNLLILGLFCAAGFLPGCLSKSRAPLVQIEPDFSYVRDEPALVLDDVYTVNRPTLVAAE